MSEVLLAGCGDVGVALGERLLARGYRVWGLRRHPERLPDAFGKIRADLGDPASLAGLPRSITHVVYGASADESSDAAYRRAYVEGLGNLLAALDPTRVRRLFFLSTTAVYAQTDGSWVDESSATEPGTFPGLRTLEAEALVAGGPVPGCSLRCAGIYGPARTGLLERVRTGRAQASRRYANRIHRDDVAGAICHLLSSDVALPRVVLCDDDPAPQIDVIRHLAARLGVPEPPPPLPDEPAPTRGGNKRCCNALLRSTGYALEYPSYREGYAPLIADVPESFP
jgi:nucleoside-diphosphate-sugar epimerase